MTGMFLERGASGELALHFHRSAVALKELLTKGATLRSGNCAAPAIKCGGKKRNGTRIKVVAELSANLDSDCCGFHAVGTAVDATDYSRGPL